MDVSREKDVEQLRLIAQTQHKELQRMARVNVHLAAQLEALTGKQGMLQKALDLEAAREAKAERTESPARGRRKKKPKKKRTSFGPTPQPELPEVTETFELDEPDKTCPAVS